MTFFVVDTNVPVVANGDTPQATLTCVLACVQALREMVENGGVVLDDDMRILREYMGYLSRSGEPGMGDAFFKWVWDHQADDTRCERVPITTRSGSAHDFEEFPDDPELRGFHRDDRKFVAVALASKNAPEILNAVDTDWWVHREALAHHGVRVKFLCPAEMNSG